MEQHVYCKIVQFCMSTQNRFVNRTFLHWRARFGDDLIILRVAAADTWIFPRESYVLHEHERSAHAGICKHKSHA
jgi:Trk K+ transport system NAD-binding subunit